MILSVSASQIKLFEESPIDWILQYCEGMKETVLAKDDARIFGSAFAASIEHVITGKPYIEDAPRDKTAMKLARQWYAANKELVEESSWFIEDELRFYVDHKLPKFVGFIDLWRRDEMNAVDLRDFKTCTHNLDSKRFYGKTEEELQNDIQLTIYAKALNAGTCRVGHEQIVKEKRKGKIVSYRFERVLTTLTQEKLNENFDKVLGLVREMLDVKRLYIEGGLGAVAKHFGVHHWSELTELYKFGKPSPFRDFYKARGNMKLEDFKEQFFKAHPPITSKIETKEEEDVEEEGGFVANW